MPGSGAMANVSQPGLNVERDRRDDVGDRRAIACDELTRLAIHPLHLLVRERALRIAEFQELQEMTLEHRMRVQRRAHD
jgi:hypothetical protein